MKKISIGYFADGPWSHGAFMKLINDDSIEFKFIVPRSDTTDLTLKELAQEYGIDYLPNVSINSKEFIEVAKNYSCDLFVSMSFNQIYKSDILDVPRLKTINCHAGKLPYYRGRNILNWVLINDEKEFGITVHYVDEGIDTGDIIVQECYPIDDNDDYSTLLERAYKGCSTLLYKGVKKIQEGKFVPIVQTEIHPVGFYCGRRGLGDEIINWNQTSREVFNFVRAIAGPGPISRTYFRGQEVKVKKVKLINKAIKYVNTVGQIVGKNGQNLIVKTQDSTIEITDYEFEGKLKIGNRFTNG